ITVAVITSMGSIFFFRGGSGAGLRFLDSIVGLAFPATDLIRLELEGLFLPVSCEFITDSPLHEYIPIVAYLPEIVNMSAGIFHPKGSLPGSFGDVA
ncbi:MAG: hypothetical protein IJA91_02250, partial [Clostridia bacterium]|nr:hypothetical protein [Clostridia bacterium]